MIWNRRDDREPQQSDDEVETIDLLEIIDPEEQAHLEARASAIAASLARGQREPSVEAPPPAPVDTEPGEPGRCPICGGPGYLDAINLREQLQQQHCRECDHWWRIDLET